MAFLVLSDLHLHLHPHHLLIVHLHLLGPLLHHFNLHLHRHLILIHLLHLIDSNQIIDRLDITEAYATKCSLSHRLLPHSHLLDHNTIVKIFEITVTAIDYSSSFVADYKYFVIDHSDNSHLYNFDLHFHSFLKDHLLHHLSHHQSPSIHYPKINFHYHILHRHPIVNFNSILFGNLHFRSTNYHFLCPP